MPCIVWFPCPCDKAFPFEMYVSTSFNPRRCETRLPWNNKLTDGPKLTMFNTLRPRQNGRLFADDTFKRIFLNDNIRISIEISLKFVPKGLIKNIPAMVLIMAWRRRGDKPLSEPMMVRSLTRICVIRPQWVNFYITTRTSTADFHLALCVTTMASNKELIRPAWEINRSLTSCHNRLLLVCLVIYQELMFANTRFAS